MKLNLNAPFFQFINTAFDFVILNICFILTCLPVFTIGAALTALYTVTMAEAEDKGLPFTKTYFHTFTRCFIRSSLLFAGCICIGALLLFCLFFWLSFESLLALIPSVLSLAALIALVICLIYLFPLLAFIQCPVYRHLPSACYRTVCRNLCGSRISLQDLVSGTYFYAPYGLQLSGLLLQFSVS